MTRLLEFGDNKWSWDPGYPSNEEWEMLPRYGRIKLSGIRYKQHNNQSQLNGLAFDFDDGSQTPMFDTEVSRL